jgi:hypothetical protein
LDLGTVRDSLQVIIGRAFQIERALLDSCVDFPEKSVCLRHLDSVKREVGAINECLTEVEDGISSRKVEGA